MKLLEDKLLEARSDLSRALTQNEKLAGTLQAEKERIEGLREEVEKLSQPPASFGVYLASNDDGSVDVFTAGRKMRVNVSPDVEADRLRKGAEVILNEALNVVEVLLPDRAGEVVKVKDRLGDDRVIVIGRGDEELVATLGTALLGEPIRAGDRCCSTRGPTSRSRSCRRKRSRSSSWRRSRTSPTRTSAVWRGRSRRSATRSSSCSCTPSCSRSTSSRRRRACSLRSAGVRQDADREGRGQVARRQGPGADRTAGRALVLPQHQGPELLNKYVGETERQIRQIFQRAKERSEEGLPVIVFFDEMDSIFRTRGTGISSDVESTIVPQLLSELDGVETLKNVIVIGASNREDLIDPAILRPGRLDVKIKIERPDAAQAADIMAKYLNPSVPIHPEDVARASGDVKVTTTRMIQSTVDRMYSEAEGNRFLEVTYASGDKEILYFKDFNSGAMIENIVRRAKKEAIKRFLSTGEKGIKSEDLRTRSVTSSRRTRTCRTRRTRTTGLASRARRASASSTCEPCSATGRARAGRSNGSAPASTCKVAGWPSPRSSAPRPSTGSPPWRPGVQPGHLVVAADQHVRRCAAADPLGLRAGVPLRDARGFEPVQLREPSEEDLGLANVILPNGARYYVDHAHPEYSTPECATPATS